MPVDQTGENILFADNGDGTVSTHVQIQYTGGAERFAWVVPLPNVPEVSIGSQPLFDALLQTTAPTYGFSQANCARRLAVEGGGGVEVGGSAAAGPSIALKQTVGAFEVVVLSGGSAEEIFTWLEDNGYEQLPEAEQALAPYADEGFVFAALKLTPGSDIDQIHPIVFRYEAEGASIPLRLTSVAASDDMAVRVFFLGEGRMVPTNALHVQLNDVRLDWLNFAANYTEVLSAALDEDAGGHGFITEFAGANPVDPGGFYSPNWSPDPFVSGGAMTAILTLESYGLLSCQAAACSSSHPLVLPLLRKHVPAPAGIDEFALYACPSCYIEELEGLDYDGAAMGRDFLERIVVPGRDAQELVDNAPYLTRMLTVLDAEEMTFDPIFHQLDGLADVSPPQLATWDLPCSGSVGGFVLPSGVSLGLDENGNWPSFEGMPSARLVEQMPLSGEPETVVDNSEAIEQALLDWNQSVGWPEEPMFAEPSEPEPLVFGEEAEFVDEALAGNDADDDSEAPVRDDDEPSRGPRADAGVDAEQADEAAEGEAPDVDDAADKGRGCGCRVNDPAADRNALWALLLAALAASLRRRGRVR